MRKLPLLLILLLATVQVVAQPKVYPSSFTVAQDGSADFKTIQEAVNAVRDLSQQQVTIHIQNGVYHEKLVIPSWKTNIYLLGESQEGTIITNADFSGKPYPGTDLTGNDKFSTYTSYTVLVQGNDFRAENLTIENAAGPVGQAVALHVEGDRAIVKNCRLLGHQDTLFTATANSRQLYQDCYIEGTTDFIFGEATVVFLRCTINSLKDSYITAAATTPRQPYGYVFINCKLLAGPEAEKVYLGRPWRPYAKTVFLDTEMGPHIRPVGWDNWRNPENERTVTYAEYHSTGAGANPNERVLWAKQLTAKEAKQYTLERIFSDWKPLQP
ncbi:pectinesterase family protein [Pontibacter sp. CAU 1760]